MTTRSSITTPSRRRGFNGVSRFLYTSSACVGWEKLYTERTCRDYWEDFGLETRTVRFRGPLEEKYREEHNHKVLIDIYDMAIERTRRAA